jgi:hypothetical protein
MTPRRQKKKYPSRHKTEKGVTTKRNQAALNFHTGV